MRDMNNYNAYEKMLNQAILDVLTHKFKKDAKESHVIVDNAGYEIYKVDGCFHIKNRATNKVICMNGRSFYHTGSNTRIRNKNQLYKINYVQALETPYNKEYYDELYYPHTSKAKTQYRNITQNKNMIKMYEEEIKRREQRIEDFKKQNENAKKQIEVYKNSLKKLREQYGLKERD